MSETQVVVQRADADLEDDIQHLIAQYPPLAKDRHVIHITVKDGLATISGHTQTRNTRRYFVDHLAEIPGLTSVNTDHFYDDDTIRLNIARVLPAGVRLARIRYGVVVLTGDNPYMTMEEENNVVRRVSGVVKVVNGFGG